MFTISAKPSRAGAAFVIKTTATAPSGTNGMNLYREANGDGNWVLIYSGELAPMILDTGEGFQVPLDPSASYVYKVEDATNSSDFAVSESQTPTTYLQVASDIVTQEILRIFKSAVNTLVLPESFSVSRIEVTHALPLDRTPRFPFITIYCSYSNQANTGIGFLQPVPPDTPYVIQELELKRFLVGIYTQTPEEREFLKDSVVAIFYGISDILGDLGWAVEWDWQATSYQVEGEKGSAPGFYACDVMLDIVGNSAITVTSPSAGIIKSVDQTFNTHPAPDASNQP